MIERHVYIKLNDEHSNPTERAAVVERSRGLSALPGVVDVTVGVPVDDGSRTAWDVAIRLRFESIDAIEPYRVHPEHRRYVDEFLKPRLAVITAWNFEV